MCEILLSPIMAERDYPSAGALLYSKICPLLDKEDKIIIDVTDVDTLPSMFLNVSLGRLLQERGVEPMKKIYFKNISKSQSQRVKEYIKKMLSN